MNTIDILIKSNKYKTKQQIFDDLSKVIWDFEPDLKKIMLKNGNYISHYWIDFFSDAMAKNIEKLQKLQNPLTVKFWNDMTSIKEAFQILLSMQRSEINNAMDKKRAGKPLINEIENYNNIEHIRQTTVDADSKLEYLLEIEKMTKEEIKKGLIQVWQNAIFDLDFDIDDMMDLCVIHGLTIDEVFTNGELDAMPASVDQDNQTFWDFP